MIKGVLLICVLGAALVACSSTIDPASPLDANRWVGQSRATILLGTGERFQARGIHFGSDSIQFLDGETDVHREIAARSVQSVHTRSHAGGALEGLIFGVIGGGATGFVLAQGEGTPKTLLYFGGLGVGSVGGLIVGALVGHDYTFVFPKDSLSARSSQEPQSAP